MSSRNKIKNTVYLVILLLPFFLFFAKSKSFSAIRMKIVSLSSGPARLLMFPLKEIKKIIYYHRTFKEYKRLKAYADVLSARLTGMEELGKENARLKSLLRLQKKLVYSSVAANVIGRNPSYWESSLIIDKGVNDGIKNGNAVVNAFGVVGKISEAGEDHSKVILLNDPQFSVAALIQRPRESGLVSGTLRGICRMRYIDNQAQIRTGDKVITSKLSTAFPEGLLIGIVTQVQKNSGDNSVECLVEPAVSFSRVEEVLVLKE